MSLINELKRRNVFRVAGAYLALGWVITQVTGAVVPALHLPESIVSIVVWIGVIGFPCVVIFSWVYELTPEGLKLESEVDRTASITHLTSRRLDYTIIAMLAIAIGLYVVDPFGSSRARPALEVPTPASSGSLPETKLAASAQPATSAAATASTALPAPSDRSIAVLPFVNMSSDKEQEYFSDGISEELLNLLAKVPELQVAARTSSFAFKGEKVDIPDVAAKLHVAHVLEGSVRKSGNTVRITTQLVRADNGYHLWSETYDRKLDDIFAVQDEIASAVVSQLKIKLLGHAPKAKVVDPKAYALYLRGRQLGRQGTAESIEGSIALYQQTLAIDPAYAAAWSGLAHDYSRRADTGLVPIDAGYRQAREAVEKALELDPDYAPAHDSLGWIAMSYDGDLVASARHYERALALEPANTDILSNAGRLLSSLGRLDSAIALGEFVVARDPVNPAGYSDLGFSYRNTDRLDEALATSRSALSLAPGRIASSYNIGVTLLLKGDAAGALTAMQQETGEGWRLFGLVMAYNALGKKAESDAALAELIQKYQKESSYNIAYSLAYRNEPDRAFEWLDKAVSYKDPGLSDIVVQAEFANIRTDPRWLPFLRKLGRAPEQLAAIKFDVKLPQ